MANPHVLIRPPPLFKSDNTDISLYMQRFQSYCNALNVEQDDRSNLLIALLDDKALAGVKRNLREDIPLNELVNLLKRAQGVTANSSERYITELRTRRRNRHEKVFEFFVTLSDLAEKAYPNNEPMKTGSLKEAFINNLNLPNVAARLRERTDLDIDRLVDYAVMLHSCQESTYNRQQLQVNFVNDDEYQNHYEPAISRQLQHLNRLIENMATSRSSPIEQDRWTSNEQVMPNSNEERRQYTPAIRSTSTALTKLEGTNSTNYDDQYEYFQ